MPHASHNMMPIIMCNIEEKIITEEKVVADGMQLFRYLLNIETIRKSNYYKHHKKEEGHVNTYGHLNISMKCLLQLCFATAMLKLYSYKSFSIQIDELNTKFETRKYIITIFCNCYGRTTVQSINA